VESSVAGLAHWFQAEVVDDEQWLFLTKFWSRRSKVLVVRATWRFPNSFVELFR
jgi:hypothetical protein